MRLARFAIALGSTLAVIGCSLLTSLDDLGGGGGNASPSDASSDASSDVGPSCNGDADLNTDPTNCGACGHDCCGGACTNGVCQPRVIATQQLVVDHVHADDKYAFWTVGTNEPLKPTDIMRVQLDGTGLGKMVNGRGVLHGYADDDKHLYWIEFTTNPAGFYITSSAKDAALTDAGAPFKAIPATSLDGGFAQANVMFVDPTYAYWIAGAKPDCPSLLTCLYRAPSVAVAAGVPGFEVLAPINLTIQVGLVQDASYFYIWTGTNTIARIRKTAVPDGGTTAETVVPPVPDVAGIAVNATRLFWSDGPAATIYAAPKVLTPDAGPPEVFATLQNVPKGGIEADDSDVYWSNADGIVTCPATGCPNGKDKPRVVVKESGISSWALTKRCFVWANAGTATVNVVGR